MRQVAISPLDVVKALAPTASPTPSPSGAPGATLSPSAGASVASHLGSAASSAATSVTPTPSPSGSGLPSSLSELVDRLGTTCGTKPDFLCRTVFDVTHSQYLASSADVLLGTPLVIIGIALFAFVLRAIGHRFIRRAAGRAAAGHGLLGSSRAGALFGDPAVLLERRRQRAETVGSVLRSVTSVVIFGIAFVTILGELGINLAPIVASAGVAGIAIGFGAQNLVRDCLSGMFMLLEDQYGVGDVIDVGTISGNVEAVTLRITRLRDVQGTVWYIRNGEIARLGNKSQQWARTVLDVPLDYDTEVQAAKRVLKRTADDMWREAAWAVVILEEPEVWGMETMTADGYTLRIVIKTQPLKQWDVARELRERVRAAFAADGIELGTMQRSEITVRDDDDDDDGRPSDEEDDGQLPGQGGQSGAGGGGLGGDDGPTPEIEPPAGAGGGGGSGGDVEGGGGRGRGSLTRPPTSR
jgi:small conductance mechanosensitive channel